MKRFHILCASGGLLLPVLVHAAPLPYYVWASGGANAEAGNPLAPITDDHPFDTGQLMQAEASGSKSAAAQAPYNIGQFISLTTAHGSADATARMGALHAYAEGYSDTGLLNPPGILMTSGLAKSQNSATATWSDTIRFRSQNPNGSDFVFSIGLEDSVHSSGVFYPVEIGFYASLADARLLFSQNNLGPVDGLEVNDRLTIYSNQPVFSAPPAQRVVSMTFHALFGVQYFTTLTGSLTVGANAINGTGHASADASNTALFALYSADPLASYDTASGTVFPTSVPEPAFGAGLVIACVALGRRSSSRRRQR